jgi:hypothetical protein
MNRVNDIISSVLTTMSPTQSVSPGNNLCCLKKAARNFLISNKRINCPIKLKQLNSIDTQDNLELYLQQFALSDSELLDIYRSSYHG